MLEIQTKHVRPDVVVLEITGRIKIGREGKQLEGAVDSLVSGERKKVAFNLTGLTHIDSTGIRIIVMSARGALQGAGRGHRPFAPEPADLRSRLTPSLTRQPKTHMRGARSLLCVSAGFQFPIFRTRLLGSDESKSGSRTSPLVPEPGGQPAKESPTGNSSRPMNWERLPLPALAKSYIGTIDFLRPQMAVVAPAEPRFGVLSVQSALPG